VLNNTGARTVLCKAIEVSNPGYEEYTIYGHSDVSLKYYDVAIYYRDICVSPSKSIDHVARYS